MFFKRVLNQSSQLRYIPLKYTLMGSFLLLIIPILLVMTISDYLNAKYNLEIAYELQQKQIESNIINAIKLVDAGHKVIERTLGQDMQLAFKQFIAAYHKVGDDPAKLDLFALKRQLGNKMDLYVINANGIVEYTTYNKDLGLDFKQFPDVFNFFTSIRQNDKFVDGRLSIETRTGLLRKFAYMPTPDHKYLLELGLTSEEFNDLMADLDLTDITDRLKVLNPSLNKIRIFTRYGQLFGDPDYQSDEETINIIKQVYENKRPLRFYNEAKRHFSDYIFINLKDEDTDINLDPSKVIQLDYNTKFIDEGLQRTSAFHMLLSFITIILSIIFTFIISAWITKPIRKLVKSVDIIAQGVLEHPITVVTNNELELLKQSINIMVQSMRNYINQIKQNNTELTELDRLKDDFLSNTSHELRTPISGIIGIAESMMDGATGTLPTKAIENLSMIVISGKRLSNLVNDILDFSKLKYKNIELQIKPVGIKVVIDVVLTLSMPLIGKRELQLINKVHNDLLIDADENRLQQILHNLISNAIKFTESGTIEILATQQNGWLKISIIDTGIGISADKLKKVFLPFEQADGSISRQYGGTGLGLSITKQLVELHGGEITIFSTPHIGTEVSFTLPLSKNEIIDQSAIVIPHTIQRMPVIIPDRMLQNTLVLDNCELQASKDKLTPHLKSDNDICESLRILIVDDDPINLQVLENQLGLENYAIIRANNGQEALRAIASGTRFAIVLLDIMMPKMSGFEVCRIIRETYPAAQLPVIMLTAKNQASDLVQGLESGANDYLTKPFSKGELITRIKTHIQLAQVNIAYSKFVPLEFLRLLEKESIIDVRLGDHIQKQMTVLFADIRSFTTLSENMTPKENFKFINAYLGRVSPVIRKHNGFIDKYIGDAVMALFPNSADDAVQASIEIHKQLMQFNIERMKQQLQPIKIGIGLHCGTLMLGTIGEEQRMEGTVISDAVNLASRLEGLTKFYGASTLISGEILAELEDPAKHCYRFLGKVRVKGKNEAVHIFEILDSESQENQEKKLALEPVFNQALEFYYQQNFKKAAKYFQQITIEFCEDKAACFYLERCEHYLKQGIPKNWQGIEALSEK